MIRRTPTIMAHPGDPIAPMCAVQPPRAPSPAAAALRRADGALSGELFDGAGFVTLFGFGAPRTVGVLT